MYTIYLPYSNVLIWYFYVVPERKPSQDYRYVRHASGRRFHRKQEAFQSDSPNIKGMRFWLNKYHMGLLNSDISHSGSWSVDTSLFSGSRGLDDRNCHWTGQVQLQVQLLEG